MNVLDKEQTDLNATDKTIDKETDETTDKVAAGHPQLDLTLGCTATGKTVLKRRYMSYPLSVSPIFRLDEQSPQTVDSPSAEAQSDGQALPSAVSNKAEPTGRAYLYRMNTSPGLLAGDALTISLKLEAGSSLLLADQAATKVHTMPITGPVEKRTANVNYAIEVGDRATLEFLPEPLILYADSTLQQTTDIRLHPSAGLSWGEIILPGRLARGERYQFDEYWSRLQIRTLRSQDALDQDALNREEHAWFVETMKLLGKHNPFTQSELFASGSVLGTLILVLPKDIATIETLQALSRQIDQLSEASESLNLASSILPGEQGVFVRAIAQTTRELQSAFKTAADCIRKIRQQPLLPYSL